METWADDWSLLFPWGSLPLLDLGRKQRMGALSRQRAAVKGRRNIQNFWWTRGVEWRKMVTQVEESQYTTCFSLNTFAEFWKQMKWEAHTHKHTQKERKEERDKASKVKNFWEVELKKQRLELKNCWENESGDHTRCAAGSYTCLHPRRSRRPEVDGALQNYISATKKISLWLNKGKRWSILTPSAQQKKKKKKKSKTFSGGR